VVVVGGRVHLVAHLLHDGLGVELRTLTVGLADVEQQPTVLGDYALL
jgi:hypothetical protein